MPVNINSISKNIDNNVDKNNIYNVTSDRTNSDRNEGW